jgi:hypothetical protein
MSGAFSVPYVVKYSKNVSGLVLVAATGVKAVPLADWERIADDTAVMFVYGANDDLIGVPTAEYLDDIDDIQVRCSAVQHANTRSHHRYPLLYPVHSITAPMSTQQFFKVKQGTHACYLDRPKQFNKKLRSFLLRKVSKGKGKKFFLEHRELGGFDKNHNPKRSKSPDSPDSPEGASTKKHREEQTKLRAALLPAPV